MNRRIWKADPPCGKVDKTVSRFRPLVEPCHCGKLPTFRSWRVAEDAVASRYGCKCGELGPEVEDSYPDSSTARSLWNAARRRAVA